MEKDWMPPVAGIACIISGCFALVGFLLLAAFGLIFLYAPEAEFHEFPLVFVQIGFGVGALVSLALGWLAIFGGACCLKRRGWGWCLAGGISATLICPPLGVAAIVLIILSERQLRPAGHT